jgi:hypothetical protein
LARWFGLHRLEATETSDFYELIVERHRQTSTVITSNRAPRDPDHDGRPTAGPIGDGPPAIGGLRTRHQRNAKLQLSVLLAPLEAGP